jgi:hypothetical protein
MGTKVLGDTPLMRSPQTTRLDYIVGGLTAMSAIGLIAFGVFSLRGLAGGVILGVSIVGVWCGSIYFSWRTILRSSHR